MGYANSTGRSSLGGPCRRPSGRRSASDTRLTDSGFVHSTWRETTRSSAAGRPFPRGAGRRLRRPCPLKQLFRIQPSCITPQPFQVVIGPRALGKNVNDQIQVVQQDPFRISIPFDVVGAIPAFLHPGFDSIGDRLDLARRISAAEEKIAGEGSDL
jgi:hypothetical protein